MSESQTLRFEDLNLKIGQVIQIHPNPEDKTNRHDCMLVGGLMGDAIIITVAPGKDEFPRLEEGQQVIIRVLSGNGVALFPTTVLFVSDMPVFMVYLDFPQAIKFHVVRNSSRVEVALPILASNTQRRQLSGIAGKISDISVGGARIELYSDAGNRGESIELKGKFRVNKIQRLVVLQATILRKEKISEGVFAYGVQFNEDDEDKLLILFGFIFNSMAFSNVQTVS